MARPPLAGLVLVLFTTLVFASCGKGAKTQLDLDDEVGPSLGGMITVGQLVEYTGHSTSTGQTPKPYSHIAETEYELVVDKETTINLEMPGTSISCVDGSRGAGPFVTLYPGQDEKVTTDLLNFPSLAVTEAVFSAALTPGRYRVLVNFFATSETCTASLSFRFQHNDLPPDPVEEPVVVPLDTALIGFWSYVDLDSSVKVARTMEISSAGSATIKANLNGELQVDKDYVMTLRPESKPARFEMETTAIRAGQAEVPKTVGDVLLCIYAIDGNATPKTLKIKCVPNAEGLPTDWSQATTFVAAAKPVPEPPKDDVLTVTLSGLSLPIPDDDSVGIIQNVVFPRDLEIKDVTIYINISHTYIADLKVSLVHPAGVEVVLHERTGIDDTTDALIATYGTGATEPEGDLKALFDMPALGTWQLKVSDNASKDTGTLHAVAIAIRY